MKNGTDKIGPLDNYIVGPKKYFKEYNIQLKGFMTPPSKMRSRHQIFKEGIGYWPLLFSLIICFIILATAITVVKLVG